MVKWMDCDLWLDAIKYVGVVFIIIISAAHLCYAMLHRQSRLGAYSAKGHFFQSLLCHLALGDTVQVK